MELGRRLLCLLVVLQFVAGYRDDHYRDRHYHVIDNATLPTARQLLEFKIDHPKPIGLLTLGAGSPVDIRDQLTLNSDVFKDNFFLDVQMHVDGERTQPRVVHPKGTAVWGHFEVTNDVSKYTKADVFNGVGKKTPVLARLSVGTTERGGPDTTRDLKGFSLKFYTKEGNLDFLNLQIPIFTFKDPIDFVPLVRAFKKSDITNLYDYTAIWDVITLRPHGLTGYLYMLSDYGAPDGWRHADYFAEHTYELTNKHGERWYAKFNWRTEQGLKNLTADEVRNIQSTDSDYYIRDIYNAVKTKEYPSWRLELDLLSLHDIQNIDYDPFDVTRLWKKGTYHTVPVGRLVLNRMTDNHFRDADQSAFDPSNLVPGIPGPVDNLFRGRRLAYRDTQSRRISTNFYKVSVNAPKYSKLYQRDGHPPIWDNMRDAPNYYPNSFHGPIAFVDEDRPKENLMLLQTNAVDLQEAHDFYNEVLKSEGERKRLIANIVETLLMTTEPLRTRVPKYLSLVDKELARRVVIGLKQALAGTNTMRGSL
ncbi:hypothetical protein O0L34_g5331 [Tuta absoluta]|nr:hypothetical protein O0L34_g5331 [Tuta absoluta]